MQILLQVLILAVGFAMLVKGADWFVDGAAGIAAKFGIPQLVIGLTIVAMGTSAPEAAVSITAALRGSADLTIGNIVGSNILNILLILGLTAFVTNIAVARSTVRVEIPFMVGITVLLLVFGMTGGRITLLEGVVFWAVFILYLLYLLRMAKNNKEEQPAAKPRPVWMLVLFTIGGLVCVVLGSNLTVNAASSIARTVGLSERLIGLTIIAFGTSLPELVTSMSAARKGNADISIGNIVGSNIFNILFVVGTTALITPVTFAPQFIMDTAIAIGAAVLLWLCAYRRHMLTHKAGALMPLCYAAYFATLVFLR